MLTVRRAARSVAVATVAALLLSGCTGAPAAPDGGAGIPAGFESFYEQQVFWNPCNEGFDCTTVSAPVDWSDPQSDRIRLAVVRQESTNTTRGTVLTNPGGPGGSGFDFVSYGYAVTPALKADYDVVGWDPRGVGRSTRIECPGGTDELLYGTYDEAYGSRGWADQVAARAGTFARSCEEASGELLAHMDTASNARDLDLLRAVLDSDKLNYVGYSYGTWLGTVYSQLFPQNVGSMVLDGGYAPTLDGFELLQQRMAASDLAFGSYLRYCLDTAGCPFSGDIDAATAAAAELIASADGTALASADGRVLSAATLATAVVSQLYTTSSWGALTTLLTAYAAGDPGPAFAAADSANSRYGDGSYGDGLAVTYAVSCLDYGFDGSLVDRLAQVDAAAPVVGRFLARDDIALLASACAQWPAPRADLPAGFDAPTAPIVVVGSTKDPATPYSWSQELVGRLANAVLVTRNGDGHTGYNKSNACVDSAVDAYMLEGTLPASDPNC